MRIRGVPRTPQLAENRLQLRPHLLPAVGLAVSQLDTSSLHD